MLLVIPWCRSDRLFRAGCVPDKARLPGVAQEGALGQDSDVTQKIDICPNSIIRRGDDVSYRVPVKTSASPADEACVPAKVWASDGIVTKRTDLTRLGTPAEQLGN